MLWIIANRSLKIEACWGLIIIIIINSYYPHISARASFVFCAYYLLFPLRIWPDRLSSIILPRDKLLIPCTLSLLILYYNVTIISEKPGPSKSAGC